jgi:HD-GYP domain-containing protein (c-di-GMP phosphodiesterase class II)
MEKQKETSILSLDWAARIMGAHLEIAKLVQVIARYLKTRIRCKKIRILLWEQAKKTFVLEAGTDIKEVSLKPKINKELLGAIDLKKPLATKGGFLIPLRDKEKFLGILLVETGARGNKLLEEEEKILELSASVSTVLANARLFIDSELRNMDMFRFNVLSRALNPTVNEDEVIKILVEGLGGIIRFDIVGLLILGKQKDRLFIKSKVPLSGQIVQTVKDNLRELIFNLTKSHLVQEKLVEKIILPPGKAGNIKINAYLNVPLIIKDKPVGVLSLFGFDKEQFAPRDVQNLSIFASHGAVALENAKLYEDLRRTYFSIINALTSAIEAKDEYTRGHSVLVSKYSVAIAAAMGLSPTMVESIQIAGLLHDLGKIGVPEEILVKKGKLTDNEYQVVQAHPEIALKILGPVEFPHFPKQANFLEAAPELTLSLFEEADLSSDVKLMIYHHHEKYAGGGYPKGIKKDEIPLGARILAVSDTFEALTADRPYRKAFPLSEARKILTQISGEQLDPEIVKVFLDLLDTKGIDSLRAQAGF